MPEEQNAVSDWWNQRFNNFASKVLNWNQLGDSNVDANCGDNGKPLGLDSVFGYRTNSKASQQVVIVEAKYRDAMKDVPRSELQKWILTLLEKVESVPYCGDFQKKFSPDDDAQFQIGVIALWINQTDTFDNSLLVERLKDIDVPDRSQAQLIYFLANDHLTRLCSLMTEMQRLQHSKEFSDLTFYFSPNGSTLIADGSVIPIDALFSEVIFMKGKRSKSKKNKDGSELDDVALCFYFGKITDLHDLKFIELAIRDLGPHDVDQIIVYLIQSLKELRSEIEQCKRTSKFELEFHQLVIADVLPDWLGN